MPLLSPPKNPPKAKEKSLTKIDTNGTLVNFVGHLDEVIKIRRSVMREKSFKVEGGYEGRKKKFLNLNRGEDEKIKSKNPVRFFIS